MDARSDPRHRRRQQPDEVGAARPARMGGARRDAQQRDRRAFAARLAQPAAADARRRRQRRGRGGARARRGAARALAPDAGMADRIRCRLRRHQPLRAAGAARRRPLGVAGGRMAALDGTDLFPPRVRRRQRGYGGDHRCARRGGRIPRRIDPSRACGSCCRRWPRTRRASRSPPGEFRAFPDNTADAIYSGAVQAICGAIEQMRRADRHQSGDRSAATWPAARPRKSDCISARRSRSSTISCSKACSRWPGK